MEPAKRSVSLRRTVVAAPARHAVPVLVPAAEQPVALVDVLQDLLAVAPLAAQPALVRHRYAPFLPSGVAHFAFAGAAPDICAAAAAQLRARGHPAPYPTILVAGPSPAL